MDNLGSEKKEPTLGGTDNKPAAPVKAETPAEAKPTVRVEQAQVKPRAPGEPAHVKPGQFDLRPRAPKSKRANRIMTACAGTLLLAIAAMAYYSTKTTSAGATAQAGQGAEKSAAAQVALTDPQCAEAYREMRDGKYSASLANTRDGCKDRFASYVKLVRTDYAIKGGALLLKDSTHSLAGMSIRKGAAQAFPFYKDQAPAIIAENGGKIVATMMFGNTQEFDVAFKLLSEAIAGASGRCAKF